MKNETFVDEEDLFLSSWNEDTQTLYRVIVDKNGYSNIRLYHRWDTAFTAVGERLFGRSQDAVKIEIPMKTLYPSFENYVKSCHGYDSRDEKTNRYGYWKQASS